MISHRFNHLPLLPSDPGGIQRELVVSDLPAAKIQKLNIHANESLHPLFGCHMPIIITFASEFQNYIHGTC